jgi:hypothetical protein
MFVTVQDNFLVWDLRSLPYFLEESRENKLGPLSWKLGDQTWPSLMEAGRLNLALSRGKLGD